MQVLLHNNIRVGTGVLSMHAIKEIYYFHHSPKLGPLE